MERYLWVVLALECHKMEMETGMVDLGYIYLPYSEGEEVYKVPELLALCHR